ncbi:hypothetical protein [Streptomyces decoyicus]|uniref:hypothetical protein n=1 Tax=Streptomyces decoyicus TaxID=249567 RepID=UPI0038233095
MRRCFSSGRGYASPHPGDLTPYAAEVYDHPRYFDAQFPPEPAPGTDTDAVAVLNALAHAGRPLTADFLAESLGWNLDRVSDAIERAWAYPHLAGPYALRRAAPAHFTLSPRLDVLTDRQMNGLHDGPASPRSAGCTPGVSRLMPDRYRLLQRAVEFDRARVEPQDA